jgi:hypothetical protein
MPIPTKAPNATAFPVYRIIAMHVSRATLPLAKMQAIATAMQNDTSGKYDFLHATGNIIIYDFAPGSTLIDLKKVITWEGVSFEALSLAKHRVVT